MNIALGVKTDPFEHRYSYDWLFDFLAECGVKNVQLGSFFEMYFLGDDWFASLRKKAEDRGLRIGSVFTSHRELGGFLTGDAAFETVTAQNHERLLRIAALVGAEYAGTNMGAVYYDKMAFKREGVRRCVEHLKRMSRLAHAHGLRALTIEPMSCLAEPPTLPEECRDIMEELAAFHQHTPATVPVYFCGDISHGYADAERTVMADNWSLFETQIPYMCEFHFKNTDAIFNSTFGFGPDEQKRGIVDLARLRALIDANAAKFPVDRITGYLEINNIKSGRDYTDTTVARYIGDSLDALREHFEFLE